MNGCITKQLEINEQTAVEQNYLLWFYFLYGENENILKKSQLDFLTKLGNREFFESSVKKYLSIRSYHNRCALFIVDVDDFKQVNDTYGHLTGDKVLINIAQVLKNSFVKGDIVSRIGGDEFVAFMKNVDSEPALLEKTQLICDLVTKCCDFPVSVSMGISLLYNREMSFEEFFKTADTALYQAKLNGKNTFHIYQESDKVAEEKLSSCLEKPRLITFLNEEIVLRLKKEKVELGFMFALAVLIFVFVILLSIRMINYAV